jgi:hypothetical protein
MAHPACNFYSAKAKCGPTQLNINFEGVSRSRGKQYLVFSGLSTLLKLRVDSIDTVQRHCWQCLHALVGATANQTKIPSVAIITVNQSTEPAPPIICYRTRWAIAKRHEVVERCAIARHSLIGLKIPDVK